MYQLELVNFGQEELLTGISIHLLGESYNPKIFNVMDDSFQPTPELPGVGRIQQAIEAWESDYEYDASRGAIILIPPNVFSEVDNLEAAHVENLIVGRPVKLQGFGT